jgi:hypothetical protein
MLTEKVKLQNWYARCRNCGRESRVLHNPAETFHFAPCLHCGITSYFDLVREAKAPREAYDISKQIPIVHPAAAGSISTEVLPVPGAVPDAGGSPLAAAIQKLRRKKTAKP